VFTSVAVKPDATPTITSPRRRLARLRLAARRNAVCAAKGARDDEPTKGDPEPGFGRAVRVHQAAGRVRLEAALAGTLPLSELSVEEATVATDEPARRPLLLGAATRSPLTRAARVPSHAFARGQPRCPSCRTVAEVACGREAVGSRCRCCGLRRGAVRPRPNTRLR
jgi:hypothetical protein